MYINAHVHTYIYLFTCIEAYNPIEHFEDEAQIVRPHLVQQKAVQRLGKAAALHSLKPMYPSQTATVLQLLDTCIHVVCLLRC